MDWIILILYIIQRAIPPSKWVTVWNEILGRGNDVSHTWAFRSIANCALLKRHVKSGHASIEYAPGISLLSNLLMSGLVPPVCQ